MVGHPQPCVGRQDVSMVQGTRSPSYGCQAPRTQTANCVSPGLLSSWHLRCLHTHTLHPEPPLDGALPLSLSGAQASQAHTGQGLSYPFPQPLIIQGHLVCKKACCFLPLLLYGATSTHLRVLVLCFGTVCFFQTPLAAMFTKAGLRLLFSVPSSP